MKVFLIAWGLIAIKLFLPALLIFFFVIKPLLGAGYGVWYSLLYLVLLCPILAALMRWNAIKKMQAKNSVRN